MIRIPEGSVRKMIKELVECLDHDLAKDLEPATAEEPEFADQLMEDLVSIVKLHGE